MCGRVFCVDARARVCKTILHRLRKFRPLALVNLRASQHVSVRAQIHVQTGEQKLTSARKSVRFENAEK